ncbi:hypothetical protein U1Q18_047388 [Sarracenia purpurea var. burkii]
MYLRHLFLHQFSLSLLSFWMQLLVRLLGCGFASWIVASEPMAAVWQSFVLLKLAIFVPCLLQSFYMMTGSYKFGDACKFHHPQPAATESILPAPGPAIYGTSSLSIALFLVCIFLEECQHFFSSY